MASPGTGSSFNIRGTTALSGSSPLVLVDGVEMDPNLINPQDVKSVSVLKDALLQLFTEHVPLTVLYLSRLKEAAKISQRRFLLMHPFLLTVRLPVLLI